MNAGDLLFWAETSTTTVPPVGDGVPFDQFIVGDSMAASGGEPDERYRWPTVLADKLQTYTGVRLTSHRYGVGGSRLGTAAQFQMGKPMTFTVTGGAIPTSGFVTITPTDGEFDIGESPTGQAAFDNFVLAGVPGVIRRPGGTHKDKITFTRNSPAATSTPAGGVQTLTHIPGTTLRDIGLIGWFGHNNLQQILGDHRYGTAYWYDTVQAMIDWWNGPYVFLGLSTGPRLPHRINGSNGADLNPDWVEVYGTGDSGLYGDFRDFVGEDHFVDVKTGLLELGAGGAYAHSGITPTAGDELAAEDGKLYTGPSMRGQGDQVGHLGRYGQAWVAESLFQHMLAHSDDWFQ